MKINIIAKILIIIISCTLFNACTIDHFDSGNYYTSALCTVKTTNQTLCLENDEGITLIPYYSEDLKGYKEGERVFVTYNYVKSSSTSTPSTTLSIMIYDIQAIPVINIQKREELAYAVNDPVWLISKPWYGGGFINIEFDFRHSSLDLQHTVHMLYDKTETVNGKKVLYLIFGHNAKNDPKRTKSPAFVSVRTNNSSYLNQVDSIVISVKEGYSWKDYGIKVN